MCKKYIEQVNDIIDTLPGLSDYKLIHLALSELLVLHYKGVDVRYIRSGLSECRGVLLPAFDDLLSVTFNLNDEKTTHRSLLVSMQINKEMDEKIVHATVQRLCKIFKSVRYTDSIDDVVTKVNRLHPSTITVERASEVHGIITLRFNVPSRKEDILYLTLGYVNIPTKWGGSDYIDLAEVFALPKDILTAEPKAVEALTPLTVLKYDKETDTIHAQRSDTPAGRLYDFVIRKDGLPQYDASVMHILESWRPMSDRVIIGIDKNDSLVTVERMPTDEWLRRVLTGTEENSNA